VHTIWNEKTSETIQGSISSMLYSIYIRDEEEEITGKYSKKKC